MKSPSGSAAELILPSVSYKMYLFLSCFVFFLTTSHLSDLFQVKIFMIAFVDFRLPHSWLIIREAACLTNHKPHCRDAGRHLAVTPPPYTSHTHVHIMLYYTMLMYTERMTNSSSALKTWELFPINHSIMILNSSGIPVSCWKFKQVKKQY